MKRISWITLLVFIFSPIAPVQSTETIGQLAQKIQKSGLGCKDAKVSKAKILYSGKRISCTVNGEQVNIESYTPKNFKLATKYICDSGFSYTAVSDSKTWIVSADSRATNQKIAKVLKSRIVNFCN